MRTSSKYKIFGGFGLMLLLNLVSASLVWIVVSKLAANNFSANILHDTGTATAIIFALAFEGTFLILFITQCKYIVIDSETITFINPLLPFIRKTKKWSDYDYCQTIEEYSRSGTHEATWLIKDSKLKDRISSFYYGNYETLKNELKLDHKGELRLTPFQQLGCLLGLRIKTAPNSAL